MTDNGISSCLKHEDHERRITILEEDYDNLNEKYTKIDKDLAVTTTSIIQTLKGLEKLPDTLNAIKDTMSVMQVSIGKTVEKTDALAEQVKLVNDKVEKTDSLIEQVKYVNDKLESVNSKVEQIDEEGKFNIRKYVKDNWIKIIISGSTLAALAKYLIE